MFYFYFLQIIQKPNEQRLVGFLFAFWKGYPIKFSKHPKIMYAKEKSNTHLYS